MTTVSFIGAGRLGSTLARAFAGLGLTVTAVASREPLKANQLASRIPGCQALPAAAAAGAADLVFISVPDDDIAAVASQLSWRQGQWVVHCSGATEVSTLDAARHAGALTGGFHPLQSFSDPDRALDLLAGSTVAIEAQGPLDAFLRDVAQRLGMFPLALPPGARALYHGGASFAASFILSMLEASVSAWRAFGVGEADALRALLPAARGNLDAAASKGLAGALAGPISRGDVGVVQRHLQAMDALGRPHATLYREFGLRQLALARQGGRLDEARANTLRDALSTHG